MKLRDLTFVAVLLILVGSFWLGPPANGALPGPRPQPNVVERGLRWFALWYLLSESPPPPPQHVQELPSHLVNRPAERLTGPDGAPLLDHAAGW